VQSSPLGPQLVTSPIILEHDITSYDHRKKPSTDLSNSILSVKDNAEDVREPRRILIQSDTVLVSPLEGELKKQTQFQQFHHNAHEVSSEFSIHTDGNMSAMNHVPDKQDKSVSGRSRTDSETSSISSNFLKENNVRISSITDRIQGGTGRENVNGPDNKRQKFKMRALAMSTPEKDFIPLLSNIESDYTKPTKFVSKIPLLSTRPSTTTGLGEKRIGTQQNVSLGFNENLLLDFEEGVVESNIETRDIDHNTTKYSYDDVHERTKEDSSPTDKSEIPTEPPTNHSFPKSENALHDVMRSPMLKSFDTDYAGGSSFLDDQSSNVSASTLSSRHISRISYNQSPTPQNTINSRTKLEKSFQSDDVSTITRAKFLKQSVFVFGESYNRSNSAPPLLNHPKQRAALSNLQFVDDGRNGSSMRDPEAETSEIIATVKATVVATKVPAKPRAWPRVVEVMDAAEQKDKRGSLDTKIPKPEDIPLPLSEDGLNNSKVINNPLESQKLHRSNKNSTCGDGTESTGSDSSIATSALSVSSVAWIDSPTTAEYRRRRAELNAQLAISPQKQLSESSQPLTTIHSALSTRAVREIGRRDTRIQKANPFPAQSVAKQRGGLELDGSRVLSDIEVGETAQGCECTPPKFLRAQTSPGEVPLIHKSTLRTSTYGENPSASGLVQPKPQHSDRHLLSPNVHKWKLQFQRSFRDFKQSQSAKSAVDQVIGSANNQQNLVVSTKIATTSHVADVDTEPDSDTDEEGLSDLEEELKQLEQKAIQACKRQARLFELLMQRDLLAPKDKGTFVKHS